MKATTSQWQITICYCTDSETKIYYKKNDNWLICVYDHYYFAHDVSSFKAKMQKNSREYNNLLHI